MKDSPALKGKGAGERKRRLRTFQRIKNDQVEKRLPGREEESRCERIV
jgi:hypothetical protein